MTHSLAHTNRGDGPVSTPTLEELFGSETRVRTVRYLASNTEPVMQFEIAAEVGCSQAMMSRTIRSLRDANIVFRHEDGGVALAENLTGKSLKEFVDTLRAVDSIGGPAAPVE